LGTDGSLISLTRAGWKFATLEHPLFDLKRPNISTRFSEEEKTFLIEHIRRAVPVEDFAICAILTAVAKGANTPEKLGKELQIYVPQESTTDRSWSEAFLSSQRSGALSRMIDIGLVDRI